MVLRRKIAQDKTNAEIEFLKLVGWLSGNKEWESRECW